MTEFKEDARYVRKPREVEILPGSTREKVLTWIHLMGGITTTPLIEEWYYRHLYTPKGTPSRESSDQCVKIILNDLFDGGWLIRPKNQERVRFRRRYPLVHQVSLEAEQLLKDRGLFSDRAPVPWGTYEHNMLVACLYQGYALSAEKHGVPFTGQHELLKDKSPYVEVTLPDSERSVKLRPDAMFMMKKDGQTDCVIFFELDRGNEATKPNDPRRKSLGRSADEYYQLIGRNAPKEKLYKRWLDLPVGVAAQVHFVTVVPRFERAMHEQVKRAGGASYFLTHICTEATDKSFPIGYIDMLAVMWNRADLPPYRWVEVDNAVA